MNRGKCMLKSIKDSGFFMSTFPGFLQLGYKKEDHGRLSKIY